MGWLSNLRFFVSVFTLVSFLMMPTAFAQPVPKQKPTAQKKINPVQLPNSVPSKPKLLLLIKDAIPSISSRSDGQLKKTISRYKKIFSLQEKGNFDGADKEISRLDNKRLMGHVLLHRYMHPKYPTQFKELENWLKRYSDHPTANRIYKLAKRRMPEGYQYTIMKPYQDTYMNGSLQLYSDPKIFTPLKIQRSDKQEQEIKALSQKIITHIENGFPTGALSTLQTSKIREHMSQSEKDILTTKIAHSFLIEGKPNEAFLNASVIADRYGEEIPLSGWVAGISAWQQNRHALAAQYFQRTASSSYANHWMVSAASYWAYRAYNKIQNKDRAEEWLREAALYPRTFYGVLANKKLGVTEEFNWSIPSFTPELRDQLLSHPRGERAYLLANLNSVNLATMELEAIDPNGNDKLKTSMLAMAGHYGLSRFLFKFGNTFKQNDGRYYDSALYPTLATWDKAKPHKIDKALIHAIIRQESRFKADAYSASGAIGLMQILPSTAAYISGQPKYKTSRKERLTSPQINVKIGEQYVSSLLNNASVQNNLFSLLIAYNAGPGTLNRWKKKINVHNDPLLFIELLPSAETRAFVERVMANLWIYRDQFKQEAPSLEAISENVWPPYRQLD